MTFFERSYEARFCFAWLYVDPLHSCIGIVAVVPMSALGCGAATTLRLVCGTRSSCGSAGISVLS